MNVDIYIKEKSGNKNREIRIPWLPEIITVETGEASVASYEIMSLGEVIIPTGVGLSVYSWESIFPGYSREVDGMLRGEKKSPSHYDDILKYWKNNGTKLNLMVTGYPINVDVYLVNYTSKPSGGFGDVEYSVSFKEARTITVTSTQSTVDTSPTKRSTAAATHGDVYVVKSGDTLWEICERFFVKGGSECMNLYTQNKRVIEEAARDHGKSSSNYGHWIYPGTKLLLKWTLDNTGKLKRK